MGSTNPMKSWTLALLIFTLLTLIPVGSTGTFAQASQQARESFSWSGELVSLDQNARILTVTSRVTGDQTPAGLGRFKAGDKIAISWSGYDKYADAINRAVSYEPAKKSLERFTFPVEYVAYDTARQYVTFKVMIPSDGVTALKSLKPGEWVTATSPHRATGESDAITSIRPYVSSSSTQPN